MSKDVFADLLKTSGKPKSAMPMAARASSASSKPATPAGGLDLDFLDQFSNKPQTTTTTTSTTSQKDDFEKLFDVFDSKPSAANVQPNPPPSVSSSSLLDLDGDFGASTSTPELPAQPAEPPQQPKPATPSTLDQLVEMGFSHEQASEAVQNTDTFDAAIGYLLDQAHQKSKPKPTGETRPPTQSRASAESEDLGALVNDLSAEFMSKASFLLNTGRKKLKQGIEMYKHQQMERNNNEPLWMRNQNKYKQNGYSEEEEIERVKRFEQERIQKSKSQEQASRPVTRTPSVASSSQSPATPAASSPAPMLLDFDEPDSSVPPASSNPGIDLFQTASKPLSSAPAPSEFQSLREKGSEYFTKGDFTNALEAYQTALARLPENHSYRIIAFSNLAIVYSRLGNAKEQLTAAESGISQTKTVSQELVLDDKPVKSFWIKLVAKKAEALEHLERFKEALETYNLLLENGGFSKQILEAKRRCADVIAPKPKPKPASSKPATRPTTKASDKSSNLSRVQEHNRKQESLENEKFALHDKVEAQLQNWKNGKEDNLRALLSTLNQVLWPELGWKSVGLTDLVLNNKVKIVYMKAVAKTHPDKLAGETSTERKLIANGVFITLNQAWDKFKEQNK
ncbi:hypothetical protein OGAPHI_005977 [Ogataea philodendri]|uniref:UBA domain-containing protein n=1 Tax=Ogataea philodendri TaxID=1378263 RepID=A0A9P8NZA5_9ASCO|nr:uncharacterized protein OGAPHI_005977 [Ogataea philodendri]KAH3661799.1 hypothetical protein OGAPHI_005977 [Ogataea philodendri]